MKLRLPKALTAALIAGMVGNISVSELRAESIENSTYSSSLSASLVYANSFNGTSAEVSGITFGSF